MIFFFISSEKNVLQKNTARKKCTVCIYGRATDHSSALGVLKADSFIVSVLPENSKILDLITY